MSDDAPQSSAGNDDDDTVHGIDRKLLDFLVCPVTHGVLRYDRDAQELISETAGLAYPVRDGIPIMLPEEARQINAD